MGGRLGLAVRKAKMTARRPASTSVRTVEALPPLQHYPGLLVRFLEERGIDRRALLEGSGIEDARIDDPGAFISLGEYGALVRNATRLTADPALGLWFGRRLKLASLGSLGVAAMSSPTLADAVTTLARYAPLRVHRMRAHIEGPDPQAGRSAPSVRLEETEDYGDLRVFLMESTIEEHQATLPISKRIRNALERAYESGSEELPSAEQMAELLDCSPRTLRRELSSTGESYRMLVEEVRCVLAKRALVRSSDSVEVIARRLGYRDVANFRRAFRRWVGMSPAEFRSVKTHRRS